MVTAELALTLPAVVLVLVICLSALSKNLKGELKPLHHVLERCAKLKCRTLKTIHFLQLNVATNAPCDSAPGKLLDGNFIVRNLITAYGGQITVSSEPGQGACFTILLPAKE